MRVSLNVERDLLRERQERRRPDHLRWLRSTSGKMSIAAVLFPVLLADEMMLPPRSITTLCA